MEGKFDFLAFQREMNELYGTEDSAWEPLNNTVVLKFEYDEKNNLSSVYKRKFVYPDWDHNSMFCAGDIWLVSLTLNPKTSTNYFAKPLRKIDASFLYEMKKSQLDEFATKLWDDNRTVLEPFLEEKYRSIMDEHIAKAVEAKTADLNKIISDQQTQIADLQKIKAQDMEIIRSNEEKIELLKAKIVVLENESAEIRSVQPEAPRAEPAVSKAPVGDKMVIERTGPDSIYSEGFTKSRYSVHLSADHRMLVIAENKAGNVICVDNTLVLAGLSNILPYNEGDVLENEFSNAFGGIAVYLK